MKIINENVQGTQMSNARFARLIKTIKSSSYVKREDDGKRFFRYTGEPPKTKVAVAGGPSWYATHRIDIIDGNTIFLKTESTHSQIVYNLTDSQMKELIDTLNSIPDVSEAR